MSFASAEEYRSALQRDAMIPQGYTFFASRLTFVPPERPDAGASTMNLSYIESDTPAVAAAVTTRNRFCGAPVTLARERIADGVLQGLLVNNKVANVASPTGLEDARRLTGAIGTIRGIQPQKLLSVSTGVIGWSLPVGAMEAQLGELAATTVHPLDVAEAIMTTDRFPKIAWNRVGDHTCLGLAKGAGMIEPNMATMLGFILCDAASDQETLDRVLRRIVNRTFNRISVDSDQSTSDMVVALANGTTGTTTEADLERMLEPVCAQLARDIVRNGEGTSHLLRVRVQGLRDDRIGDRIARHVANSPLVKTAIYGNDPNVGRILGALGDALDTWDPDNRIEIGEVRIALFGREVFREGAFRLSGAVERALSEQLLESAFDPALRGYPQEREAVPIDIQFSDQIDTEVVVYGSDLSYEYIRENADYRT